MEKFKGKVGEHSVDSESISCPICYRKMEVHRIEPQTFERDYILTDRFLGEDIVTAYAEERKYPVIMKCPECGSTLRIELETVRIERKEERQIRMVDMMAGIRFGDKKL